MGRPRKAPAATSGISDVVADLQSSMNKRATGHKVYLQGDHAEHTWGLPIPSLAFQWLVGGSSVLPLQRFFGVSGEPKSYKSTLMVEIGNWFINAGGIHFAQDSEHKTSPSMLDAMSWHNGVAEKRQRLFTPVDSIDEWQTKLTDIIKRARVISNRPEGSRIPIWATVDSLTGKSTADTIEKIEKEGAAPERQFATAAAKITYYLEAINLLKTTMAVGWVQHLKKAVGDDGGGYGGPEMREKGASMASFQCSTHIRVRKGGVIHAASHESAPNKDIPVEGHTLYLRSNLTCIGPSNRNLPVDLLWQYIPQEDGTQRQAMWFDWDGALGRMLAWMKYSDKWTPKLYQYDKDRLDEAVFFTEPKTNRIKCDTLGLDGVSYTEFGKAILANPEVKDKVTKYLAIASFPDFQTANIELGEDDEDE